MAKFKVGDRVRIRPNLKDIQITKDGDFSGGWTGGMKRMLKPGFIGIVGIPNKHGTSHDIKSVDNNFEYMVHDSALIPCVEDVIKSDIQRAIDGELLEITLKSGTQLSNGRFIGYCFRFEMDIGGGVEFNYTLDENLGLIDPSSDLTATFQSNKKKYHHVAVKWYKDSNIWFNYNLSDDELNEKKKSWETYKILETYFK